MFSAIKKQVRKIFGISSTPQPAEKPKRDSGKKKSKDIVECINEEARKGRLYRLTDTGKDVLETIEKKEKKD